MAYLGNAPARSFISFERQVFTIVNSQTAYTLSHSVTNENDIRLVINNIVQEPGSGKAYTASGTTLTLSAALVNGTDEMYCVFLGRATATNAPAAGSVGTSQIADDAVTLAKMASGTDGNIISYDASGNPVAVATGSAGQVLTSAGAGAPPTFATATSADNTPYFYAFLSSSQTVSDATTTTVAFNSELVDTASAFDTSNYRFTPQTAGYYQLHAQVNCDATAVDSLQLAQMFIRKNGSDVSNSFVDGRNDEIGYAQTPSLSVIVQANGSSDYFTVAAYVDSSSGSQRFYGSSTSPTFFWGYKIIS